MTGLASPAAGGAKGAPSEDRLELLRRIAQHCRNYQGPDLKRSIGQTALSLGLYLGLTAAVIAAVSAGWWIVAVILAPLTAGLLVKLFTIQHDCGHGSYFRNKAANTALGWTISLLTFTPYGFWRDAHNRHHASSGDLSRRGIGGVDTLTVEEYLALPRFKRIAYRLYRHPVVMIVIGAPLYFLVLQRLPLTGPMPFAETYQTVDPRKAWKSVLGLNVGLVAFYGALVSAFGIVPVLSAVLPAIVIAAWIGTWLFFVQHQYENAYWAGREEWSYAEAAIYGSSHYDLPRPLHWITGNIGLHHIHHLASRIPNYRLFECLRGSEDFLRLPRLSMADSVKCARLALWDAAQKKMISFAALKRRLRAAAA